MTSAALPRGPRARFPGELLMRLSKDRLPFLIELARTYGDVVPFRIGGQQLVLLVHPDDVRDVLVTHQKLFTKGKALERSKQLIGNGLLTSEGEFHLRQRRLVQPAFHRARVATYASAMTDAASTMRDRWVDGQRVDMHAEMMRLTMVIVASTLFGARLESDATAVGHALEDVFDAFDLGYGPLTVITDRLPTPRRRRFRAARALLDNIIYRLIRERRLDGTDHGDLLSMLLQAQDTEGDGTGMTDEQLRDELLTLFIAGHETTANALTWTWLLLARHPEAANTLHAELDAVLGSGDRVPTVEDLAALPYTRAVVSESMRLYPPAYIIGRRASEPYSVGGTEFPARTLYLTSQYLTHRDPRWWPAPTAFRPERWLTPDESWPKFAYFPFGAGTRICIGEQFAWMEAILLLATLARRWTVRVDGPDPELDPIITLRPKGGLAAQLERRS
jgi:cytochrome P450